MTNEQTDNERRTFQSNTQIQMLCLHDSICHVASIIYTPIRKVLESFGETVHMNERPKLRVIK
jgi:hypothetical protein